MHDLSHSQLPVFFFFSFADCIELFHPWLQRIQSDFGIYHLLMSMYRVFSCVVRKGCLLWLLRFLGKTLLVFALLHSVLQRQICLFLQVSLEFFLLYSSPYDEKDIFFFFGVSSRMSYRSSQNHSTSASLGLGGWGIDLDYCNIEWFALEMNRDHSVIFEIAPKYCISDSCCLWGLLHYF